MRAVTVNEYGGTPTVAEVPTPQPGPRQILIKLSAAGMNPMDRTLAAGVRRRLPATFPMVLGADGAGVVEAIGEGTTRFSPGDVVFGQLLVSPLGSAGTYAEYVAAPGDAPLAPVPAGLDPVLAAAFPTAGATGLAIVEQLEPLTGKVVLIVGAGGGVGSFVTQFAANAGARVIAHVRAAAAERMFAYGATGIIDHTTIDHTDFSLPEAVRLVHPEGIDVLIDLVSDAAVFAALASLVRAGGSALTTRYVADLESLAIAEVTGINFALQDSSELLERVADAVVAGRIVAPPVTRITLDEAAAALSAPPTGHADGKTVITL